MRKKILFIEDDRLLVKLYTTRLELDGLTVVWAEDGQEGLKKFDQEKPNLVVLDIMVPKISGIEVLKKIRSQNKKIPVIIYSVLADKKRAAKLKTLGANEYLVKSNIAPKTLIKKIKKYL